MTDTYALLDSGDGKKLERFGPYTLARPAGQAIWKPSFPDKEWDNADGIFIREGEFRWVRKISGEWIVEINGIKLRLSSTDFGHLGVFPEQKDLWRWIGSTLKKEQENRKQPLKVLNLFAYSGGATLVASREGAEVCHLDASKGMVTWARENAELNSLDKNPIRWIVDDVRKFLSREIRRKSFYDAVILDPPSFGKGSQGQVFKFERDLYELLEQCRDVLSKKPLFILLSCHTPNISSNGLHNILSQVMQDFSGKVEQGELMLKGGARAMPLPNGTFARWLGER
jgi:23S rRNA (cytosine1962-C5)-methyltransferase